MKTLFILLVGIILLTGCLPRAMQPPPDAWTKYYKQKRYDTPEDIVRKDMINCGFDNSSDNIHMLLDKNKVELAAKAGYCMIQKGYTTDWDKKHGACNGNLTGKTEFCMKVKESLKKEAKR